MTRPDGLEFKTLAVANPTEPDAQGVIEALVAVTGVKDEVNDFIEPGAFRRTLTERAKPKVCLGHDWNRPIGKTLDLQELMPGDSRLPKLTADRQPWPRGAGALWARFQTNLDSDDGRSAFSAAKFYGPEQSTYSIGYRTTRARQRGSTRHILDLDLFEYGPVLNPANRLATLQSIKSDEQLTNLVDSERQDFETGDDAMETKKIKYVRDANYWGKPLGTPITPGMKPRGGTDPKVGVSSNPEKSASVFSDLPDDEQAIVRAMTAGQRVAYLRIRASGKDHDEAMEEVRPQATEESPRRAEDSAQSNRKPASGRVASKPQKTAPAKPTVKQEALLLSARPGRAMTFRRDDSGNKVLVGPFPEREGLIFQGHASDAYPMEKAGWAEATYDGRHYILTPEGEGLRVRLESESVDTESESATSEEAAPAAEAKPAPPVAVPPRVVATEKLPEQEMLPYEVIKRPNRSGKGGRIRFNGREYTVDATGGVLAEVTATDDDGHSSTVTGGSNTLLRRDQRADRERALRQALTQVEAQHVAGAETPREPEPAEQVATPQRVTAPGAVTSQAEALAALDRAATDDDPRKAGPAARIAEEIRDGSRKVVTSMDAPAGLYMLSPPAHLPKGGYPWQVQAASALRVPIDSMFVRGLERFAPNSGKRAKSMLEAFVEVRDAEGNPPPWGDADTTWVREWRDANGLTAGDAAIRFALPAYLRRIGADDKADEFERGLGPLPSVPESESSSTDEERSTLPEDEAETVEIPIDQIDEAAALQDEVAGITELPDGTIEVTEEVAARQDRVAALIEQDEAGTLDLAGKAEPELTETRHDLTEELRLQSVLATRQAAPKPTILTSPAGQAEKPPQRPGLAGAAEDYSEALQSGDAEAIARTRARLESSLRRSRAGSESARTLADHVTGEDDDDAEQLATLARTLRRETRERRNASAQRRRTARRLERVRIQSLIDKIDSELQSRARSTEPQQADPPPSPVRTVATIPEHRLRYGGMSDAELEAARLDARQRAQTDASAMNDLTMIRKEMDYRESLNADVAKAPAATASEPISQYTEHVIAVRDLKVGDLIKSFVPELVPNMRVTRAPQLGFNDRYDYDTDHQPGRRAKGTDTVVLLKAAVDPSDAKALTLARNYEQMHGTAGVRAMVERLRRRVNNNTISRGDRALLTALEGLLVPA